MKTRSIPFAFGLTICILLPSCIATYQSIQPEALTIDDYRFVNSDSTIQMSMDYDVLTGPRNKIYAKMEKKNKLCLMAVNIQNSGQKELYIPSDMVILSGSGDTIQPLEFENALELLVEPVLDEESSGPVDVEVTGIIGTILGAGKLTNQLKKVQSHFRFIDDMKKNYLIAQHISSDTNVTGFLVLPVPKGTSLNISLRQTSSHQ
ncbi:MAG: hypothetical protein ABJB16_08920 [Saprospiraceae bacterium]